MATTVRPLSPDEERLWRSLMRLVVTVPRVMSDDLKRSSGLNGTEYLVLMHLSEAADQGLRMSDLAGRTALSAGRMTRVVDDLVAGCLVERRRSPVDGRSMVASLTAAGLERLQSAYPDHLDSVRRSVLAGLDDHEAALVGVALQGMADRVDAANPPPRRTAAG